MTYTVEWTSGGEHWGTIPHDDIHGALAEAYQAMRDHPISGGRASLVWVGRTIDCEGVCVHVRVTPLSLRADGGLVVAGPERSKIVSLDLEGMVR